MADPRRDDRDARRHLQAALVECLPTSDKLAALIDRTVDSPRVTALYLAKLAAGEMFGLTYVVERSPAAILLLRWDHDSGRRVLVVTAAISTSTRRRVFPALEAALSDWGRANGAAAIRAGSGRLGFVRVLRGLGWSLDEFVYRKDLR